MSSVLTTLWSLYFRICNKKLRNKEQKERNCFLYPYFLTNFKRERGWVLGELGDQNGSKNSCYRSSCSNL